MLFSSLNDPSQKTTEHLVVFRCRERLVLLPLPKTYQDGMQAVKQEFSLPDNCDISFETREIPGCGGEAVEIHPRTWKTMAPILAQITVVIDRPPAVGRQVSEVPTLPDETRVEDMLAGTGQAKEDTPSRDDQPAAVSKVRKRPSMAVPGNMLPQGANTQRPIGHPSTSARSTAGSSGPSKPFLTPFSTLQRQEVPAGYNAATPTSTQPLSTEDEDQLEEEQYLRSPKKGSSRTARKRVMSDDEDEFDQANTSTPQTDNVATQPTPSLFSSTTGAGLLKTPKQERVTPPPNKEARTPPPSMSSDTLVASSMLRPTAAVVNPTETCLITVDYDDGNEVCSSTFKTKGRHTVHKVLMTVCKTFSLEHVYHRASLMRVISESTDDTDSEDQVMEQRFICPREHTMTQVGAHDNARFAIAIQDEESDTA
ncbi:hypothetical protein BC835DRAFT_441970 [Cytidiella melzeri]|nr:hypothetical protein BC835DRAFT_441970 [Cytidiella melzeri]